MNYYNEIELSARRWLQELIKDGQIADGYVDNRPIQEVRADELARAGFHQCHFFAGIGGWSYALRLAGIADDEPLWTGSCPCQPFSDSGSQMGFADPRHLFPAWRRLIARGRPSIVLGEQVASKLGREWLARVRLEMATLGYATRGADLCSAGIAAPNLRQRLYWLADTIGERTRRPGSTESGSNWKDNGISGAHGRESIGALADATISRRSIADKSTNTSQDEIGGPRCKQSQRNGSTKPLAISDSGRCIEHPEQHREKKQASSDRDPQGQHARRRRELCAGVVGVAQGDTNDSGRKGRRLRRGGDTGELPPWSSGVVGILCTDGKTRRIKPEIFPLAPRLPGDLGLIRGAGNAINPWLAAEFIAACF